MSKKMYGNKVTDIVCSVALVVEWDWLVYCVDQSRSAVSTVICVYQDSFKAVTTTVCMYTETKGYRIYSLS